MQRRAQLALMVVLLLLAAPLNSALCGARCLSAIVHPVTVHHACMRADGCCHHAQRAALCNASTNPDLLAVLASSDTAADHDTTLILASFPSDGHPSSAQSATLSREASSPPGQSSVLALAPLRI